MANDIAVTATMVLYNNKRPEFEKAIEAVLACADVRKFAIVDNSERRLSSRLFGNDRVRYIHSGKNLGFGAGHNLGFAAVADHGEFHLIINPDIFFEMGELERLIEFLSENDSVSAVMPRIIYRNGDLQRLAKLLPTPYDVLVRRFSPFESLKRKNNVRFEMHSLPLDRPTNVPCLSGCFLLFRSVAFQEIGGFDPRFFMYFEDFDLVRRLRSYGDTVFFPLSVVVHGYRKGSYRNWRLLYFHISSAIRYFNKWGWFSDCDRAVVNSQAENDLLEA